MASTGTAKTYTMAEVGAHKKKDSCWLVFDGKVYDVTKFLSDHPGGEDILLEHAGQDATKIFKDYGHSNDAKKIREKYLIGTLAK